MIRATTFKGKSVAVFGLGASGNATVQSLLAGGATVAAWDDSEAGRAAAEKAGVPLVDLSKADWSKFSSLILAPGVPLTHPEPHWVVLKAREVGVLKAREAKVLKARQAGVEIIGDVEIFARERAAHCPGAPFIAITGTNGKSTTTALIAHILKSAGHDVQMGGNIGRAILTLEPPAPDRFHVIEMSSFQIDLTPTLHPTIGVLLNITPDHLERHGTLEHYAAVKERLIKNTNLTVIGRNAARVLFDLAERERRPASFDVGDQISGSEDAPVCVHDGWLKTGPSLETRFDLRGIPSLRGAHNGENAAAAFAALRMIVPDKTIIQYMRTFPGLAHRMEEIGRLGKVLFINDSKATNADSTEKALLSFPRDVFWILGGKPKDGGIEPLRPYFPGIRRAYLIGAASEEFSKTLDGDVAIVPCGTLDVAVAAATRDALSSGAPEPVVLLSPACASYDQFKNFEVRGDAFRALVAALPGIQLKGAP